jgi:hypothetical protein
MFKTNELEDLLARGNFQIVETKKIIHGLTDYLIVARKNDPA